VSPSDLDAYDALAESALPGWEEMNGSAMEETSPLDCAVWSLTGAVREAWGVRDALAADLHRVTMERDGARDLAQEAQEARIKQSLELAEARAEVVRLNARVAELESLAAGPRLAITDAAPDESQSWAILVSGRTFVRASVFRGLTCWHAKHEESLKGAMGNTPSEAVENLASALDFDGAMVLPVVDAPAGGST